MKGSLTADWFLTVLVIEYIGVIQPNVLLQMME